MANQQQKTLPTGKFSVLSVSKDEEKGSLPKPITKKTNNVVFGSNILESAAQNKDKAPTLDPACVALECHSPGLLRNGKKKENDTAGSMGDPVAPPAKTSEMQPASSSVSASAPAAPKASKTQENGKQVRLGSTLARSVGAIAVLQHPEDTTNPTPPAPSGSETRVRTAFASNPGAVGSETKEKIVGVELSSAVQMDIYVKRSDDGGAWSPPVHQKHKNAAVVDTAAVPSAKTQPSAPAAQAKTKKEPSTKASKPSEGNVASATSTPASATSTALNPSTKSVSTERFAILHDPAVEVLPVPIAAAERSYKTQPLGADPRQVPDSVKSQMMPSLEEAGTTRFALWASNEQVWKSSVQVGKVPKAQAPASKKVPPEKEKQPTLKPAQPKQPTAESVAKDQGPVPVAQVKEAASVPACSTKTVSTGRFALLHDPSVTVNPVPIMPVAPENKAEPLGMDPRNVSQPVKSDMMSLEEAGVTRFGLWAAKDKIWQQSVETEDEEPQPQQQQQQPKEEATVAPPAQKNAKGKAEKTKQKVSSKQEPKAKAAKGPGKDKKMAVQNGVPPASQPVAPLSDVGPREPATKTVPSCRFSMLHDPALDVVPVPASTSAPPNTSQPLGADPRSVTHSDRMVVLEESGVTRFALWAASNQIWRHNVRPKEERKPGPAEAAPETKSKQSGEKKEQDVKNQKNEAAALAAATTEPTAISRSVAEQPESAETTIEFLGSTPASTLEDAPDANIALTETESSEGLDMLQNDLAQAEEAYNRSANGDIGAMQQDLAAILETSKEDKSQGSMPSEEKPVAVAAQSESEPSAPAAQIAVETTGAFSVSKALAKFDKPENVALMPDKTLTPSSKQRETKKFKEKMVAPAAAAKLSTEKDKGDASSDAGAFSVSKALAKFDKPENVALMPDKSLAPTSETTKKSDGGRYVLLLETLQSFDREVVSNQQIAKTVLDANGIEYKTLDGADLANKARRNELFAMSRIRAKYPQFFLVDRGSTTFWGDWGKFQTTNENNQIAAELGRAQAAAPVTRGDEKVEKKVDVQTSDRHVLVLVSLQSFDREVVANQQQATTVLAANGVAFETLDGSDLSNKSRRNELFAISGVRAKYPQFFVVEDGDTTFWGGWEKFQTVNENKEVASTFGGATVAPARQDALSRDVASPELQTKFPQFFKIEEGQKGWGRGSLAEKNSKTLPDPRLLVLISNQSFSREGVANQEKALTILGNHNIPFETLDGANQDNKTRRSELFALSGLRGHYPQFFVIREGATTFWGTWDQLEAANDEDGLKSILHPMPAAGLVAENGENTTKPTEDPAESDVSDKAAVHEAPAAVQPEVQPSEVETSNQQAADADSASDDTGGQDKSDQPADSQGAGVQDADSQDKAVFDEPPASVQPEVQPPEVETSSQQAAVADSAADNTGEQAKSDQPADSQGAEVKDVADSQEKHVETKSETELQMNPVVAAVGTAAVATSKARHVTTSEITQSTDTVEVAAKSLSAEKNASTDEVTERDVLFAESMDKSEAPQPVTPERDESQLQEPGTPRSPHTPDAQGKSRAIDLAAVQPTAEKGRETEVTVYGATSVVAKHVLSYLLQASIHLRKPLKVTLAGRSETKLKQLNDELSKKMGNLLLVKKKGKKNRANFDYFVAEASEADKLRAMASRTKVVLNCAGPFNLHSSGVVAACVESGTDYVDMTGEVHWASKMRDTYGAASKSSGSRIVSFCGFDSIPSDMAIFAAVNALREKVKGKVEIEKGTTWHSCAGGGFNGGTIHSMVDIPIDWKSVVRPVPFLIDDPLALAHPSVRNDESMAETKKRLASAEWRNQLPTYHTFLTWAFSAPFLMAAVNAKVVHESAMALQYGPNFVYFERFLPVGFRGSKHLKGLTVIPVLLVQLGMLLGLIVLKLPVLGEFVARTFFPPGTGPSDVSCQNGYAEVYAEVESAEDGSGKVHKANCFLKFKGDPGNWVTAQCISEAALCLTLDKSRLPPKSEDGFGSPAEIIGAALLKRLTNSKVRTVECTTNVRKKTDKNEHQMFD